MVSVEEKNAMISGTRLFTFTFLNWIKAPIVLIKQWCLLKKKCDDQRDTAFHFAATLSFRLALPQRRANTYTTKGVCSKSYFDIENPDFGFRSKSKHKSMSIFVDTHSSKHLGNSCRLLSTAAAAVGYWTCKQDLEVVCTPILAKMCFLKQYMYDEIVVFDTVCTMKWQWDWWSCNNWLLGCFVINSS